MEDEIEKSLNIRSHSIIGSHHSWAVTMRGLINEFIKLNHNLYIKSINKYANVPESWSNFIDKDISNPDLDICYTAPINFESRFARASKVKAAIYNYETIPLPRIFSGTHKHLDYIFPSSSFSKRVFLEDGWPEEKLVVIPHGIKKEDFLEKRKLRLRNNKKFKFLNVAIAHYRKNIPLLVEAYYDAFNSKDDVCLVIKTQVTPTLGKKRNRFDQLVARDIALLQKKIISQGRRADSLPIIELIEERFDSMIPLYNSCDVFVTASSSEGFGIPLLEALAANMLVISPRCTGQLDFLNDKNSLLVDVKTIKAPPEYQYWTVSDKSWTYMPIKKSLSIEMRNSYDNYKKLKKKFRKEQSRVVEEFTWENAAKKILELL